MDYKYIEQLLERYWQGETSLEEEEILRTFFCQKDLPEGLQQYAPLFAYQREETRTDRLGDDFDRRMLELVGEQQPVKARTLSLTRRMMPMFKAAAVVAIFLTLGNAAQVAFSGADRSQPANSHGISRHSDAIPVAKADTVRLDSIKKVQQEMSSAIIK
ncbi:MAG: pyruvate ferredoxin oxidoreductase [Prevotella sp.]|uniref:pyruvate ferredoxin oxidoreductase n=1 Tax=Prevotella sp. TaxID=59823 RepID=UPI002A32551C|nr:pyruvate ferredoxin oxidoreductase [Prevotella sp.]MDD7317208.1 pyruvate ferredoxin oxidoreductase [Prevotellaceae bacterium]MDY4019812.1 pyruvate ferredoxin oxidoreductase [Prevotella sp.]